MFSGGNNMGGFFVAWVLLFLNIYIYILIEDLAEGQVF